jgi:SAM-dependent methyltransferase
MTSVEQHYTRGDLGAKLLAALRAAGKNVERLTPADLALVDQFHTRGAEATRELAQNAGLRAGERVLDVGGGIGGPARMLAAERGVSVTALDLVEEFCRVGEDLTARVGLGGRVRFRLGSALAPSFEPASFDVAWSQHSSMNIADKAGLYRELARVVRPGGRLALHEVQGGSAGPLHFPVPWASVPEISFLVPSEDVRALARRSGFRELRWEDETPRAIEWARERLVTVAQGRGPLGPQVLLGELARPMMENHLRNLEEGRTRVVQAVFERAG